MGQDVGLEVSAVTTPFALSLSKGGSPLSRRSLEEERCFDKLSTNGEGAGTPATSFSLSLEALE